MSEAPPSLSLVILCYRSGEGAREFVARTREALAGAGVDSYELILVGNYVEGSEDRTPAVVRELAAGDPRIRCRAEPKRGWMGWDLRSGMELAAGDYVGFIDGDGQMPVSDVPALYRLIRQGGHDLVMTFRTTRGDGPLRRLLSGGYNLLFHLLFPGVGARDVNSKPKLLTREAWSRMELRSDDWFIDAEIMIQARRLRLRVGEIPTRFRGLSGRRSFVNAGTVLEFLRNLARHRIREWTRPAG